MTSCNYCEERDVYDILAALADKEKICYNCLSMVIPKLIKYIENTIDIDNRDIVDIEDIVELADIFLGFIKNCEGRLRNE